MLALQAVALWAVVRDRPAIAGIATVSAAVAAKLAAVPLLLVLAVRGATPVRPRRRGDDPGAGRTHRRFRPRRQLVALRRRPRRGYPPAAGDPVGDRLPVGLVVLRPPVHPRPALEPRRDRGAAVAGDDPRHRRDRCRVRRHAVARAVGAGGHGRGGRGGGRAARARARAGVPLRDAGHPGGRRPRALVRGSVPTRARRPLAGARVRPARRAAAVRGP